MTGTAGTGEPGMSGGESSSGAVRRGVFESQQFSRNRANKCLFLTFLHTDGHHTASSSASALLLGKAIGNAAYSFE